MTTPRIEENMIEKDGQFYIRCEAHEEVVRRAHQAGKKEGIDEVAEKVQNNIERLAINHKWQADFTFALKDSLRKALQDNK